jgi:hypothetical protein
MKKYTYLILSIFLYSCAQFVPPTGGKQDKTPPKLLSSIPENKTINFSGKSIILLFDEYIDIASVKQELLITPDPNIDLDVKMKEKSVRINFSKKLDSNTTYTFNFRNGIKDLNEKNPAKNLKLVLSTGPKIDSLGIKGTIIDLHTKKPILDATVALYTLTDTLPLLKRKPAYFIKTDSSGLFEIENIKNNNYKVLAFTDRNSNLLFDEKNEKIGFRTDTLKLNETINLDTLEIYRANLMHNKIRKVNSRETIFTITLDKDIKEVFIEKKPADTTVLYNFKKSEINFYKMTKNNIDTLNLEIIVADSLQIQDTLTQKIYFTKPIATPRKKTLENMLIETNIKNNQYLHKELNYNLTFQYPITRFDTSKVQFKTDTLLTEKPTYTFTNPFTLEIAITTKAQKQVELIFPSNTFENYKGDTNNLIALKNIILQNNQMGILEGTTKNKEGIKIAQLINSDSQKIEQQQTFKDKYIFKNIVPGDYQIKIIYDKNQNGIWDPGNIYLNQLPEKISITQEPIKIKANYEIKYKEID